MTRPRLFKVNRHVSSTLSIGVALTIFFNAMPTNAGILFPDPVGGWTYTYTGDQATASLDGDWDHDNGSDQWDGTAPGVGKPGGAGIFEQDGDTFIRIQDTGNPTQYGVAEPSNRKVYFTRNVTDDDGASNTYLDDGVTLSFRARIPQPGKASGPLDELHRHGAGAVAPWPAEGNGFPLDFSGKGMFGVRQASTDAIISFSLALPSDTRAGPEAGATGGLLMNHLNGTSSNGDIDTTDGGEVNLLPITDPTDWHEYWITIEAGGAGTHEVSIYVDGSFEPTVFDVTAGDGNDEDYDYITFGVAGTNYDGAVDVDFYSYKNSFASLEMPLVLNGGGSTYFQDFDGMATKTGRAMPGGWTGVTSAGVADRIDGLGLTDGFLTVPSNANDGVLGVLNLGGNADSFGPAPDGFIPTWTAELAGPNPADPQFGRDDVIADNATDRALGIGRENNDDPGELNFEIEIADNAMRAFVVDWDLEIWGGDPDAAFRSPESPGMAVDVTVGATSYATMTANLLPGDSFDSIEDGNSDHNATLIDGNVHSVRGMTTGIKEVSNTDGAVGNTVQLNFNANWNGAFDGDANGWFSAVDNVRLRALAPGDADANGVVDVTDLLQLLGGQKFNQGVDGVTWEQGDFNADDQFDTDDLLAMLSFLSGTFPSDPYASEAGGANDAVADIIVNSETGEVTVDLAGHTVSAVIIESAGEIFNGEQPQWETTSQFPSTLPGELGNVLFTSTASGTDELGAVISAEFLGRDKEFYLQDLDLNILIASEGGALTKGNVVVVPEPSTWLMLGLGSLLFVGWRQVKRSPGKQ